MKILLTIVIANYNYGRFLSDALDSVSKQCGTPFLIDGRPVLPLSGSDIAVELIVCDAASTDASCEVLRRNAQILSWWCSERDHGQSEAFNKGFSHARGEWLTWLNADEMYLPGVLAKFAALVRRHPQAKWVTGNDLSFNDDSREIVHVSWGPHRQPHFLRGKRAPFAVFGPTSFWRRDLYARIGPIDETLHFAMDFDYWIRLTVAGVRQYRLNCHVWAFRLHDESKTSGERAKRLLEKRTAEFNYLQEKCDYHYSYSWRNPWYLAWMLCRVVDGSLFVRYWKRWSLTGRKLNDVI